MTHKNPFELRAEMLTLAKDYMDHQFHMNVQFAKEMFEQGRMQWEDVQKAHKMYTIDELMEKAKEMYGFVSKKE